MNDAIFIEIQRLCRLVHERGLSEVAVTRPDFSVMLTAVKRENVVVTPSVVRPVSQQAIATEPVSVAEEPTIQGVAIASPLVGIFYRSSSPDSAPFVEIGDSVEVGQVIGIIEAMKVFNEITSDYAGTVVTIPAENGKLVQAGDPLIIIDEQG